MARRRAPSPIPESRSDRPAPNDIPERTDHGSDLSSSPMRLYDSDPEIGQDELMTSPTHVEDLEAPVPDSLPTTSPAHLFVNNTMASLGIRSPFQQEASRASRQPISPPSYRVAFRSRGLATPPRATPSSVSHPPTITAPRGRGRPPGASRHMAARPAAGVPSRRAAGLSRHAPRDTVLLRTVRAAVTVSRDDKEFLGVFLIGFLNSRHHLSVIHEVANALELSHVDMYYKLSRLARRLAPSSRTLLQRVRVPAEPAEADPEVEVERSDPEV